jgi:hypothetical protein
MYYINRIYPRNWNGTVGIRGWRLFSPYGKINTQDMRNFRDLLQEAGIGWHFSWVGSDPAQKSREFAHAELDTPEFRNRYTVERHPTEGVPLKLKNPGSMWLPSYVEKNMDKYVHLFEEGPYECNIRTRGSLGDG